MTMLATTMMPPTDEVGGAIMSTLYFYFLLVCFCLKNPMQLSLFHSLFVVGST